MHCSKCLVTITELKEAVNSLAMVNWQTRSMLLIIYESTTYERVVRIKFDIYVFMTYFHFVSLYY
jgi:hypothetical protein